MNSNASHAAKGWTVVIAALSINLILGVLYAWGVIAKVLVSDWHWTKTDATLPFTVATVCFAGMMVFAGRGQDKFGPRIFATAGGVVLGLGLLASALVHSPIAMALTFGVGAGLAAQMADAVVPRDHRRRQLAPGLRPVGAVDAVLVRAVVHDNREVGWREL